MKPALCLALALLLPLSNPAVSAPPEPPEPPYRSSLDAPLFYQILLGELYLRAGDASTAYALMLDAARRTHEPRLFKRAVDIALEAREGDAALEAARAWRKDQPHSLAAGRLLLQLLVALNRIEETEPLLRELLEDIAPSERASAIASIPALFANVRSGRDAAERVTRALADALRQPDTAPAAHAAIARLWLQAGDASAALEATRRALDHDPRSEAAALVAAELVGPEQPTAEALVERYLSAAQPPSTSVLLTYTQSLIRQGRRAEAMQWLERATREAPQQAQAWLALGLLQADEGLARAAHASLERYLALTEAEAARHPGGRNTALMALARLALRSGQIEEAQRWVAQLPEDAESLQPVTLKASLLAAQGKLDEARRLIQSWPAASAEQEVARLMAEVRLLQDHGQPAEAFRLLEEGVNRWPDDPDLRYELALAAERRGDLARMERELRTLIERHPRFHHAYNALGYSMAERNVNLDEARQLILKALEFAPKDPLILDSLGWVEYRLGNLSRAREILEGAFAAMPDAEIAAHLGEVLWALGDREQARRVWEAGARINPNNATLTATRKRLTGEKP
jgi:tetratricopeptide (TPR) repeat protein